ncbi:MAG: DNA cytosine methyltransferase [Burkholderiaceae bacterium]|nr:DNA cytosine methyltransferase [Burkholderiaceae bacterium]
MKVAGLFSGIGGLEIPFRAHGATTALLCDVWDASRAVLEHRFPGTQISSDIVKLKSLPKGTTVVTAGFPCTDLSQAGRTAGIGGRESGLVSHVFRLLRRHEVEWLVLENVRNMLVLDNGKAMHYLVDRLEKLHFRWAYRLVDSRFSGVPQRRHRVLLVASRHHDPRRVLFADEAGDPGPTGRTDAFGFYWTEGLTGIGWGDDCVPPLKGGSTVGIPSPPAVWLPNEAPGRRFVTFSIQDAEALQGFERGWTEAAQTNSRNGPRWKLVGNAVTVGVADWLVGRLFHPGDAAIESRPVDIVERWPDAAYGAKQKVWKFAASHWPIRQPYRHLYDVLTKSDLKPLSHKAAAGFQERRLRSSLRPHEAFDRDLAEHVEFTKPITSRPRRGASERAARPV